MANDLTGDFDVVAEFAIPAVNRVLAAMHRVERFPHSLSVRVDDTKVHKPSIVASVDSFGDVTVNQQQIATAPLPGHLVATNAIFSALDVVVNSDVLSAYQPPTVPSRLKGRAQLQLFPPSIEVADGSGRNVTVRLEMMSRYFPDPHTSRIAEFIRGELRITAPVTRIASEKANVIEVDIKADDVTIDFNHAWSSQPLSAEDLAAIELVIRNALKTSFLPSSAPLTLLSRVKHLQFKTLLGSESAVAALLNLNGGQGNPTSLDKVFLRAGDGFALAARRDLIQLPQVVVRDHRVPRGYTLIIGSPAIDFQEGRVLVTINARAESSHWYYPSFDIRIKQALTLKLVATTATGPLDTAELAFLGDVSLEVSYIPDFLVNGFKPSIRQALKEKIDDLQPMVRDQLRVDQLANFLKSLLKPAHPKPGAPLTEDLTPELAYTAFDIKPAGIVLHGSVAVPNWPPAHVEFEEIPAIGGSGPGHGVAPIDTFSEGPDYSALKSWIPGGTIRVFEWSTEGQTPPGYTDEHKFVLIHPPPAVFGSAASTTAPSDIASPPTAVSDGTPSKIPVPGYVPLCLTIRGVRVSSSGQAVEHSVAASVCGCTSFPIVNGLLSRSGRELPLVALTHAGPGGLIQVAGHTLARVDETGRRTPNLIVHFGDEKSAGHLALLTQALRESGRKDAATAVLAVLSPDHLATARYTAGVIYAEDAGGAWEQVFGVKTARRPLTLVVAPTGKVAWQHEGELDRQTLAATLRGLLVAGDSVAVSLLSSSARIGHPPPNFLFEYAPGRELTLRKLAGRAAVLVFWRSSSKPSIEAVRDQQSGAGRAGGQPPVVLAINDGEAIATANRVAAENGLSANLVTDPERRISLAYGVNVWPTTVFIDELGLVSWIRNGRTGHAAEPVQSKQLPLGSARG